MERKRFFLQRDTYTSLTANSKQRKHPLEKDAPEPRRIESPAMGKVSAIPKVGGLHHYYTRRAA